LFLFQVGAPAPGGQYAHYKEDLYLYGQRAFGMPPDRHYRMLHLAGEEKPPIVVLSVVVIEAEGLEAKDANGKMRHATDLLLIRLKFHRNIRLRGDDICDKG
jgi:hypothetical protein